MISRIDYFFFSGIHSKPHKRSKSNAFKTKRGKTPQRIQRPSKTIRSQPKVSQNFKIKTFPKSNTRIRNSKPIKSSNPKQIVRYVRKPSKMTQPLKPIPKRDSAKIKVTKNTYQGKIYAKPHKTNGNPQKSMKKSKKRKTIGKTPKKSSTSIKSSGSPKRSRKQNTKTISKAKPKLSQSKSTRNGMMKSTRNGKKSTKLSKKIGITKKKRPMSGKKYKSKGLKSGGKRGGYKEHKKKSYILKFDLVK